ncbi:MAG: thiamine pyrophosphate-binding protein [Planctomycetota bacterium]|nr:thiamine pyrophosphate-binding protein [Planctomycetota bacterium]
MPDENKKPLTWEKVADLDELPEGRVKSVGIDAAGTREKTICLTHFEGQYGALDNACPHQGGPLGEGSIECNDDGGCYLRCPWHGWDYHPLTGKPPGGYDDGVETYPVEVREDGVYVGLEIEIPHQRTVTDVMVETMVQWGVTHVFGMVGHSNLGLADAIRRRVVAGQLQYSGIRHEGAAAFAVSAFGKLTGRPAACLAIAGPGATNLLTGCWDAKVDRAPMLALTGQVNQQVFGPGAFQEVPLLEAFNSVSNFNHIVLPGSRHGELMSLALKSAIVERNVSNLIFPDDVQTIPAEDSVQAWSPQWRVGPVGIAPPQESIDQAFELLHQAKRPVIVVGHGARDEMRTIIALAEELKCPVLTTFKAKGIIGDCGAVSGGHPLGGGVLGRSGTPIASWFMNESDVLLVFGASFSNHTGITPKKPIIQVDYDRMQLGKFHPVQVPVWGELGVTATMLLDRLKGSHASIDHTEEIATRWKIWRDEKESRRRDDRQSGLSSSVVFEAMNRVIPADAIITVDVGNNAYSFGRYFESSGRQSVLMSGYLGSIGFGYPAAMGAWAATQAHKVSDDPHWQKYRDRPVVCVTGDGGFGQYAWEVNSAVLQGMNITHILLNNNELGKISKEQRAGDWDVWATKLNNPSIAEYVTSCGGLGLRIEGQDSLDSAIMQALAHAGPSTVEIMTDVDLL